MVSMYVLFVKIVLVVVCVSFFVNGIRCKIRKLLTCSGLVPLPLALVPAVVLKLVLVLGLLMLRPSLGLGLWSLP